MESSIFRRDGARAVLLFPTLILPAVLLCSPSLLWSLGSREQPQGRQERKEDARGAGETGQDEGERERAGGEPGAREGRARALSEEEPRLKEARMRMVESQIAARGVTDPAVLRAMRSVPRHEFVPRGSVSSAYADHPLRIGEGQTISQPYIVALMTELLEPETDDRVLEVGTGSGYQAAVLAEIVRQVYTIEIKEVLHRRATEDLGRLGYEKVHTRHGDGYFGWEEAAPFDGIMITAAVDHVPPPLLQQLEDGGKMVLPLGDPYSLYGQSLVVVTRSGGDYRLREILAVRFVPMTGEALEGSSREKPR